MRGGMGRGFCFRSLSLFITLRVEVGLCVRSWSCARGRLENALLLLISVDESGPGYDAHKYTNARRSCCPFFFVVVEIFAVVRRVFVFVFVFVSWRPFGLPCVHLFHPFFGLFFVRLTTKPQCQVLGTLFEQSAKISIIIINIKKHFDVCAHSFPVVGENWYFFMVATF